MGMTRSSSSRFSTPVEPSSPPFWSRTVEDPRLWVLGCSVLWTVFNLTTLFS